MTSTIPIIRDGRQEWVSLTREAQRAEAERSAYDEFTSYRRTIAVNLITVMAIKPDDPRFDEDDRVGELALRVDELSTAIARRMYPDAIPPKLEVCPKCRGADLPDHVCEHCQSRGVVKISA